MKKMALIPQLGLFVATMAFNAHATDLPNKTQGAIKGYTNDISGGLYIAVGKHEDKKSQTEKTHVLYWHDHR